VLLYRDKKLKVMSLKRISDEEALQIMDEFLDKQDEPKVGIFWYDPRDGVLFGLDKRSVSELSGQKTVKTLHKDLWSKEYNRRKHKNLPLGQFQGNYADTPRGRIFYQDGKFAIKTGSWIDDYPEAKQDIIDEFDLQDQDYQFEYGIHWELGHGYEG
jgi:hypothetical protein